MTGRHPAILVGVLGAIALLAAVSCARNPSIDLTPAERHFLQEHPTLRWAPDSSFAPVEWVDDAGQVKGLCPDYMVLLGRKLGVQFEPVVTHDWSEALAAVQQHRADLVSAASDLPERHGDFLFTAPYLEIPMVLLVRAGDSTATVKELDTRTLAVERGLAVKHDYLRKTYPRLRLVEVESVDDSLQRLALGSVDSALANLAQASWAIEKRQLTGIQVAGPFPEGPSKFAMGVRGDLPLLRSVLDKALASLTPEERQDLRRRWISLQIKGWRPTRAFWGVSGSLVGIALILLVLAWNRSLRRQVTERTGELAKAGEELRVLSLTDTLTGLKNRRYIDALMPEDVARVRRLHTDLRIRPERLHKNVDMVFAMVDLDHFKAVNDQHGHAAGDRVLQHVSAALRGATRDSDTVVRWGGEEFLVVGRNTDRAEVPQFVERLHQAVAAQPCDLGDGAPLSCSCSIGFALMPFVCAEPDYLGWEEIVDLADRCLYVAKRNGRDRAIGIIASDATTSAELKGRLEDLGALVRTPLVRAFTSRGRIEDVVWP